MKYLGFGHITFSVCRPIFKDLLQEHEVIIEDCITLPERFLSLLEGGSNQQHLALIGRTGTVEITAFGSQDSTCNSCRSAHSVVSDFVLESPFLELFVSQGSFVILQNLLGSSTDPQGAIVLKGLAGRPGLRVFGGRFDPAGTTNLDSHGLVSFALYCPLLAHQNAQEISGSVSEGVRIAGRRFQISFIRLEGLILELITRLD